MAIYNNREVIVIGPNTQQNAPTTISIKYLKDGAQENVSTGRVRFTEDEKKALQKLYPSTFENVETVSDEDVRAVRLGVAPSYDLSAKEAAETEAQRIKQTEVAAEQNKKLQEEAKKNVDAKVDAPTSKPTFAPKSPAFNQVKK